MLHRAMARLNHSARNTACCPKRHEERYEATPTRDLRTAAAARAPGVRGMRRGIRGAPDRRRPRVPAALTPVTGLYAAVRADRHALARLEARAALHGERLGGAVVHAHGHALRGAAAGGRGLH